MNKKRRKEIEKIAGKLSSLKYDLDFIKDEEDDSRDCMPENLENTENYTKSEDASDILDDAISDLDNILDDLEKIYTNNL